MDKVQRNEKKKQKAYPFVCRSCCFYGTFVGENEKLRCSNCNSASVYTSGPLSKEFIQDNSDLVNHISGLPGKLPSPKQVTRPIRIVVDYSNHLYDICAPSVRMAVVEKDKKKGLQKLKKAVKKAYPHIEDVFVEDFTIHLEDPLILIQKLQSICIYADRQTIESYIKKEGFIGRDVWCKTCNFTSAVNLFRDESFSCPNGESHDVFFGQGFHDPHEFLCPRYLGMYIKGQIPLHRFFKCQNCGVHGCIVDWKKKKTRCFSCMSEGLEFISSHLPDDSNFDHMYQRCPTCKRKDAELLGYIKTGEENVARRCYKFCKKCNKIFLTISGYEYRCGFGDEFDFCSKSSVDERYKGKSCPKCKEVKNLIPIWYGWPSKKEFKEAKEGKIFLGGCNARIRKLFRFCKKCKVYF